MNDPGPFHINERDRILFEHLTRPLTVESTFGDLPLPVHVSEFVPTGIAVMFGTSRILVWNLVSDTLSELSYEQVMAEMDDEMFDRVWDRIRASLDRELVTDEA